MPWYVASNSELEIKLTQFIRLNSLPICVDVHNDRAMRMTHNSIFLPANAITWIIFVSVARDFPRLLIMLALRDGSPFLNIFFFFPIFLLRLRLLLRLNYNSQPSISCGLAVFGMQYSYVFARPWHIIACMDVRPFCFLCIASTRFHHGSVCYVSHAKLHSPIVCVSVCVLLFFHIYELWFFGVDCSVALGRDGSNE